MELDARKQKILSAVIENYVLYGEPTSSKALQNDMDLNISSATIRNELMYLVENGYLEQRHTSAGRIPTQKGYRYYIDNLSEEVFLSDREKEYIEARIKSGATSPELILNKASEVLSEFTNLASVVTTPPPFESRVYKVKFVATSRHTAMAILVTTNGAVKSKIFRCDFVITPELIAMFDKMVNKHLSGVKLTDIDKVFLQSVASKMGEITLYMPQVLFSVYEAVKLAMNTSVVISGMTNLLFVDGYDLLSARNVLRFLNDTKRLSDFLNKKSGTKVYLGCESEIQELSDSSIITTRYEINDEKAGSVALIGPLRVDYKKNLALVKFVAYVVSKEINELLDIQRR